MEKTIHVLHVLGTLNMGGAESRVMDLYHNCDRNKMQFDFAIHTNVRTYYEKEVEAMGGRIYRLPRFRFWNYFGYKKAWKELFRQHPEFQAVHGHMTSTASIYLPLAKKAGIPITIAHARSAGVDRGIKGILTRFLRRNLKNKTDYCFACSTLAAEAVFGKEMTEKGKVKVIPNAIQGELYRFDEERSIRLRRELGVEEQFVMGHVGRFHPCKNHSFLLDIFSVYKEHHPKSVLLLLGEGGEMEKIKKKAETLGLSEAVRFLGNHRDIQDYYQIFDAFVFPSFYEGMPGSVVEAQAAGVPCFVSDRVTREVAYTDLVTFLDIDAPASEWVKQIEKRNANRQKDRYEEVVKAGFDVSGQVAELQRFYETGCF